MVVRSLLAEDSIEHLCRKQACERGTPFLCENRLSTRATERKGRPPPAPESLDLLGLARNGTLSAGSRRDLRDDAP